MWCSTERVMEVSYLYPVSVPVSVSVPDVVQGLQQRQEQRQQSVSHPRFLPNNERVGARHPRRCFIFAFRSGFGGAWHRRWCSGTLVADPVSTSQLIPNSPCSLSPEAKGAEATKNPHFRILVNGAAMPPRLLEIV